MLEHRKNRIKQKAQFTATLLVVRMYVCQSPILFYSFRWLGRHLGKELISPNVGVGMIYWNCFWLNFTFGARNITQYQNFCNKTGEKSQPTATAQNLLIEIQAMTLFLQNFSPQTIQRMKFRSLTCKMAKKPVDRISLHCPVFTLKITK